MAVRWIPVGLVWLAVAGCAQNRYAARDLPCEFQAAPIVNPQTLDLSGLAGPSPDSEFIAPGDVVKVSIAGGMTSEEIIELNLRVDENGTAVLPQIGPIQLAGLDMGEAERNIAAACIQSGVYRQPQVTVAEKRQRMNRVTVVGAVEEPGVKELPRGSSYLLEALVAAGGLGDDAGTTVEIRRPGNAGPSPGNPVMKFASANGEMPGTPQAVPTAGDGGLFHSVRLDLTQAVTQPSGEYLPDGSVVMVQKRQLPPLQVIGLVKKPGEFDFPVGREVRVLGAIAMAGGLTYNIADRALVIRSGEIGAPPVVIKVNLQRAKADGQENLLLSPGDIVSVEHNLPTMVFEGLGLMRVGIGASLPLF
jgi:polysaccharide export outer membrane protein